MENIYSIYGQAFHSYSFPPLHLAEPLARERGRERALVSARAREGEGDEGGERRGVAVASLSFVSYDIYRKW